MGAEVRRSLRRSQALRDGVTAIAPLAVGIVPFGLIAGSLPVSRGLGGGTAIAFSTIVFAGSAQIAAMDALAGDAGVGVAVVTAIAINLRMLLYSASIAPQLADVSQRRRVIMSYVLTDQAYAVSVTRWARGHHDADDRWWFFVAAGLTLWACWQAATIVGVAIGGSLPASWHVEFAIPLSFLVLLVPSVVDRSSWVAALVGGGGAVVAVAVGGARFAVIIGAIAGIVAGAAVEFRGQGRP